MIIIATSRFWIFEPNMCGQVHAARLHDGSDVENLLRLVNTFNLLPEGLYARQAAEVRAVFRLLRRWLECNTLDGLHTCLMLLQDAAMQMSTCTCDTALSSIATCLKMPTIHMAGGERGAGSGV